jgi:hypothetical protein
MECSPPMKLPALMLILTAFQSVPQSDTKPPARCVNINTVSTTQLITLEGITPELADEIIKGRPYQSFGSVWNVFPTEVFEKHMFRFCFRSGNQREVQVIPGNKVDKIRFETNPKGESAPSVQPLPKETIEEAEKVK